MTAFYSRGGDAIAYVANDEYLYLWNGKPVAYLRDGKVYAFSGKFLGWYEQGWLRDRANRPSLFGPDAEGGPIKPVRHVAPVKGVKRVKPVRGVRQVTPAKPARSISWSGAADESYFDQ